MALKRKTKGYALFGNHDSIASLRDGLHVILKFQMSKHSLNRGKNILGRIYFQRLGCRRQSEKLWSKWLTSSTCINTLRIKSNNGKYFDSI